MGNRWKMNRIGFVNFWLYDEEEFEFYDGKLLLRGQNGSGKSITTQSFIPFVLDGDRTPSRLDPFGSSDRRMEYYFLGEEGKEEATGYLFLEFKKEKEEAYRTIGIGQRAKRGKAMDFWGFIILDGKRIGRDLWLYKETGSTKIPYDKREMKVELGENNLFTDSQSEYKKLVNQYIFGFRRAEQYEQFIKLLVKVRAPKLSKEFKPTKVYDILNESLQTLSDEDLRTMVDAMEKMDEIQESLDLLNRAYGDVKIIQNEYTRYNQYMLAKKAQAYLKKKDDTESAQREYEEKQKEQNELKSELKDIETELAEIAAKVKLAQAEKNGLLDANLENLDRKLEDAKNEKEQLLQKLCNFEKKISEYKEKIFAKETELKMIRGSLEEQQDKLKAEKQELQECQEILKWDKHENAIHIIGMEQTNDFEHVFEGLRLYKQLLSECKRLIHDFEEVSRKYDEVAEELEQIGKKKIEKEQKLSEAERSVLESQDNWIVELYSKAKTATIWKPQEEVLKEAEEQIREYYNSADAEKIYELLRNDYENQRRVWFEKKQQITGEINACEERISLVKQELSELQNKEEIEPDRNERVLYSRKCMQQAGIDAIPFYKTVEFSEELSEQECAQLEAQLEGMGLLDALVVTEEDYAKIEELCPEYIDTVIRVASEGNSGFSKLILSEKLSEKLAESVRKILNNIYENTVGNGVSLGKNGQFVQGILTGRAGKTEAEFLGCLARQRKKEQRMQLLKAEIEERELVLLQLQEKAEETGNGLEILDQEYKDIPNLQNLSLAIENQKTCSMELERINADYSKTDQKEKECADKKQLQYQKMLLKCKPLPYGRTEEEYDEVLGTLDDYLYIWQNCKELCMKIEGERDRLRTAQEILEQNEQNMDETFVEKRSCNTQKEEYEIQIRQYEEYMNSPEIREKTQRLEKLKSELFELGEKERKLGEERIRKEERQKSLEASEPQKRLRLQELIAEETILRELFEEELSLKLVVERENRSLAECGKEALKMLRDSDKNREYTDMFYSLNQVYQKHNGSLINYGTSLEECFESARVWSGVGDEFQPLRKRMRVVSVWKGKKVFLEEFYQIIKAAIEETELLIQRKDRELFEDILSQTISQQLTDRIDESRSWVKDMSNLMKELDTSMGLTFSLDWIPRSAENDMELDTKELEQILLRDHTLLAPEDIEKVAGHFRSKIRMEKMRLEEEGGLINYMELVRDALDYRKWFEFRMFYKRGDENKKQLTNAAFNRFSGGEKAMAMYVPLFAAVNAQYKKADNEDYPRMIALDEAFAGVDDKNIASMFELVHKMDFDYIMNSQSLWGCYETVKGIKISELQRPMNSQIVTVIRYIWNGHERILDAQ